MQPSARAAPAASQAGVRPLSSAALFIAVVPSIKVGARAGSSGEVVVAPVASPGASRLRLRQRGALNSDLWSGLRRWGRSRTVGV
jgi:hypothetical protein